MNTPTTPRQRDSASLKILGIFFVILGILVMVGTFWISDNDRAVIVNLFSGALLTLIGVAMLSIARRLAREPGTVGAPESE